MDTHEGEIIHTNVWLPTPQREGDKFLMEHMGKQYKGQNSILQQLNRCRKFLQVTTLADITTASGKELCPWALSGTKDTNRPSTNTWINQGPIKKQYWKMWERCLKGTFCIKNKKKTTHMLQHKLGEWSELERHQN